MNEDVTPETEVVGTDGQVEQTPEVTTEIEGQGNEGEAETLETVTPSLDPELAGFFEKKGWTPDNGVQQLLKSYQALESKLGNWNQIEEKATAWDKAQQYLENMEQTQGLTQQQMLNLPAERLANLIQSGHLGLADLPPQRQAETIQFLTAQQAAIERAHETQAKSLIEKHPIMKDPQVGLMVANLVEKGMTDPKTGRELGPEEIVAWVEGLSKTFEKQGEERIKKDTEMLKQGNLERTGAAVKTKPMQVIKTPRDAFLAAQRELEDKE